MDFDCFNYLKMDKIIGKVESGQGLGKTIGYPTINIVIDSDNYEEGVYVCDVVVDGVMYYGAGYVGEKKGLASGKSVCEVYLFEDCGDLYERSVEITLLEKIRDVAKVDSLEELKVLIDKDVEYAKDYLNTRK